MCAWRPGGLAFACVCAWRPGVCVFAFVGACAWRPGGLETWRLGGLDAWRPELYTFLLKKDFSQIYNENFKLPKV